MIALGVLFDSVIFGLKCAFAFGIALCICDWLAWAFGPPDDRSTRDKIDEIESDIRDEKAVQIHRRVSASRARREQARDERPDDTRHMGEIVPTQGPSPSSDD